MSLIFEIPRKLIPDKAAILQGCKKMVDRRSVVLPDDEQSDRGGHEDAGISPASALKEY